MMWKECYLEGTSGVQGPESAIWYRKCYLYGEHHDARDIEFGIGDFYGRLDAVLRQLGSCCG